MPGAMGSRAGIRRPAWASCPSVAGPAGARRPRRRRWSARRPGPCRRALALGDLRAQHPDALALPAVRRARTRRPAPATGREHGCAPRVPARVKSMPRLALVDLGGVGDACRRLAARRSARRAPDRPGPRTIRSAPRSRADRAARRRSCPARSARVPRQADRPGVEPLVHAHNGRRRLRVPGHDGALDRRGAAPARQGRGMQVEAAVPRRLEHRLRQDQPVSDDHRRRRRQCAAKACCSARP